MPEAACRKPHRPKTLRRQLARLALLAAARVLWSVSSVIDYDIANRFVNLAYDRSLLESALDIGTAGQGAARTASTSTCRRSRCRCCSRASRAVSTTSSPGPNGEYITGEPDLPPPPDPFSERVNYYDENYQGRPVRIVTLRLPLETGNNREHGPGAGRRKPSPARNEFARQIMLRMMLPQVAADRARGARCCGTPSGRGLAPLDGAAARDREPLAPRPLRAAGGADAAGGAAADPRDERAARAAVARARRAAALHRRRRAPAAHADRGAQDADRARAAADAVRRGARHPAPAAHGDRADDAPRQPAAVARARRAAGGRACRRPSASISRALARDATTEWVPRALERNIDLGFDSRFAGGARRRRSVPAARDAEQPARQRDPLHAAAADRSRCASPADARRRGADAWKTTGPAFPRRSARASSSASIACWAPAPKAAAWGSRSCARSRKATAATSQLAQRRRAARGTSCVTHHAARWQPERQRWKDPSVRQR